MSKYIIKETDNGCVVNIDGVDVGTYKTEEEAQDIIFEQGADCLVDGSWGIYVPGRLAVLMGRSWNLKSEDIDILKDGPTHEYCNETWDDVLNYAYHVDKDGQKWTLYQDGDLFAYPEISYE